MIEIQSPTTIRDQIQFNSSHYGDRTWLISPETSHSVSFREVKETVLKIGQTLLDSGIEVFAQNVETVERLTHPVRDPRAGYQQTLDVLAHGKAYRSDVITKTSLMLGLGETEDEIKRCMDDLRRHRIDVLTLGQYLQPTRHHLSVERYVTPEEFERYRDWGLARGFLEVVSGAFVRSSYRAERVLEQNNVGLGPG